MLQPDYFLAVLRSRSRRVVAVVTLSVSLGICWALQSPTYIARVVVHDEDICPHGYLKPTVIRSASNGNDVCPHCISKSGQ